MEKVEVAAEKPFLGLDIMDENKFGQMPSVGLWQKKYELMLANIGGEQIIESNKVKLLGINIDSGLTFNEHLKKH